MAEGLEGMHQYVHDVVGALGCIRDHEADGAVHEQAPPIGHADHGLHGGPGPGLLGEQEATSPTLVAVRRAPHAQE